MFWKLLEERPGRVQVSSEKEGNGREEKSGRRLSFEVERERDDETTREHSRKLIEREEEREASEGRTHFDQTP